MGCIDNETYRPLQWHGCHLSPVYDEQGVVVTLYPEEGSVEYLILSFRGYMRLHEFPCLRWLPEKGWWLLDNGVGYEVVKVRNGLNSITAECKEIVVKKDDQWQYGPPPNEQLVEVEYRGEIIEVMAYYGRYGYLPHWRNKSGTRTWDVQAFHRWRHIDN